MKRKRFICHGHVRRITVLSCALQCGSDLDAGTIATSCCQISIVCVALLHFFATGNLKAAFDTLFSIASPCSLETTPYTDTRFANGPFKDLVFVLQFP